MNFNYDSFSKQLWVMEIFPKMQKILDESIKKNEIVNLLESLLGIIDHFGKFLFVNETIFSLDKISLSNCSSNGTFEKLVEMLKLILQRKSCCQIEEEAENNSELEDEIDYDEELIDAVCSIISNLSFKFKEEFSEIFYEFLTKGFLSYLKRKDLLAERCLIFQCISDSLENCKKILPRIVKETDLLEIIDSNLKKNLKKNNLDEELFKQIALIIGCLFEADKENIDKENDLKITGESVMKIHLENSFKNLENIFINAEDIGKDTVIASTAKILLANRIGNKEINSLEIYGKLLDTILNYLPLKNEPRMNYDVLRYIYFLSKHDKSNDGNNGESTSAENQKFLCGKYSRKIFNFISYMTLKVADIDNELDKNMLRKIKFLLDCFSTIMKNEFDNYLANGFSDQYEKNKFLAVFQNLKI